MYRRMAVGGMFYPAGAAECRRQLDICLEGDCALQGFEGPAAAAIVPHASWTYSGPIAGRVFKAIYSLGAPATFVILGAVHSWGRPLPAIYASGGWETPLGEVAVDEALAEAVMAALGGQLESNPDAHSSEHSIEVQIPFIRHLFAGARILPILVPPVSGAAAFGRELGELLRDREDVVVIGSTDLTHYGRRFGFAPQGTGRAALRWVKEKNDRAMIALMVNTEAEKVVSEAQEHHNACGAGAIAATLAAARVRGRAQGRLIDYSTSQDVRPDSEPGDFVGYAGVIF